MYKMQNTPLASRADAMVKTGKRMLDHGKQERAKSVHHSSVTTWQAAQASRRLVCPESDACRGSHLSGAPAGRDVPLKGRSIGTYSLQDVGAQGT